MAWVPLTLDPQARTIIVGFLDGVVRTLYRAETAWLRIQSFKPHNGPVNTAVMSSDGKILATGGNDGHVFFMRCLEFDLGHSPTPYKPIGFSKVGGPVRSLSWCHDNEALLVTLQNGKLFELEFCGMLEPESTSSFILNIPLNQHTLKQPHTKALEESEAGSKARAPKSDAEDDNISCAIYSKFDRRVVIAAFEAPSVSLVIEVDTKQPQKSRYLSLDACAGHSKPTVCFLQCYQEYKYLITGHDDGAVTLRNFVNESGFIRIQVHDGNIKIIGAFLAYDGNFILTAGSDGLLVVNRVLLKDLEMTDVNSAVEIKETRPESKTLNVSVHDGLEFSSEDERYPTIPSDAPSDVHDTAKENAVISSDDVHSDAYSLEDERLKSDEDACRAAAERKKEVVRQVVLQMRRDFEELERENSTLSPEQRLDSNELIVDPAFVQTLEDKGEFLVEELRHEHLYESEKSKAQLKKLKDYFLNDLEKHTNCVMEGQSMRALLSPHQVGSFRTAQLTGPLKQLLNQVHASMRGEEHGGVQLRMNSDQVIAAHHEIANTDTSTNYIADCAAKPLECGNRQSTLEWRKLMRAQRKAKLASLLQKKPAADTDDPRDLCAIERSKARLGDYKLKSTLDYEVPPDQQVNASKKRQQMMMLQENINSIKVRYNKRFLALRDVKKLVFQSILESERQRKSLEESITNLIDECGIGNEKSDLKFTETLFNNNNRSQSLELDEWPDTTRTMSVAERVIHQAVGGCPVTNKKMEFTHQLSIKASESLFDLPLVRMLPTAINVGNPTKVEQDIKWCLALRLHHEGTLVFSKMKEHVDAFDRALRELRKEHIPLNSDLKAAEMRLLLLLQVSLNHTIVVMVA